jgi:hypothetical protein
LYKVYGTSTVDIITLSILSRAIDRGAGDVKLKIAAICTLLPWPAHHASSRFRNFDGPWWMVSYGAVLCYSETSKIEWVDVNLNQERNAYDVPKCVIITIQALEEDTCKTH